MLTLTDEQLEWLAERVPDAPVSPLGGRPALDKRRALRGIFWILDNGAKWKDLPRRFGSKSAVHRWFQAWVREGVFERIMRDAGRCVERVDSRAGLWRAFGRVARSRSTMPNDRARTYPRGSELRIVAARRRTRPSTGPTLL